ncbi:MAG: hypothetical protein A3G18_12995 [Rhodospirillales bacterium RIFCSPLOWO2_12_FULL_58_28]|nr:MAG: hypothetical protein A3H92_12850 [Rhodospirillales bacterium RIFCSPLOWO2_02_FULL_58_16]OHC78499.1 MAG: hypothetical protein A3G18_12995 [Rhodospirillales bacterium RIFCSPLOWO2_12_FULL_58_28]
MTIKTPTLALVHGWGFDAGFWDPLRAALPEFPSVTIELGFCGGKAWSGEIPPGPLVAVGHSLGFLWLLHEKPFPWRAMVSINGFPRFTEGDGFTPAVEPKTLERMSAGLERSPEKTVADFMTRCGGDKPPDGLDKERLRRGLEWLRDWDRRAALESERTPVLALAGRFDPIVPPAMSEAAFKGLANVVLRWHDGGHLLPRTAPDRCAERIRECLERL